LRGRGNSEKGGIEVSQEIVTLQSQQCWPSSIISRMSAKGHKRKRSIHDTPVDLSKMKMAISHLASLKEELDGIQETEVEMESVMEHVHALQKILESAKKPVCTTFTLAKPSSYYLVVATQLFNHD
jgi:hypothetical protein